MMPYTPSEQETKTIKYLNQLRQARSQHSEKSTEKRYEEELADLRQSSHPLPSLTNNPYYPRDLQSDQVQVEFRDQQRKHVSVRRHKKGKSMDLNQLRQESETARQNPPLNMWGRDRQGKVAINSQYIDELRQKNSTSQMRSYNVSKKLPINTKNVYAMPPNTNRKKTKSNTQLQLKDLKKQIKGVMQMTPLTSRNNKKNKEKSNSKTNKKPNKSSSSQRHYSKSVQINFQKKLRSGQKDRKSSKRVSELASVSFTLPITTKMVSLYSNSSSVYSSRSSLKGSRAQQINILTQQSICDLPQIRAYESAGIDSNASSLLLINKSSLIHRLDDQLEPVDKTRNIINNFLQTFKDSSNLSFLARSSLMDLREIRYSQPQYNLDSEVNAVTIQGEENKDDSQAAKAFKKKVAEQENCLQQLDVLIGQIEGSNKKSEEKEVQNMLEKIRMMVPKPQTQKTEIETKNKIDQEQSNQDKNELLKSSVSGSESVQGVNLQLLDQALRQRQNYLIQRKQKQLLRLEQTQITLQQLTIQREKLQKWMDHQIKQVRNTRNHLWKGVNQAKTLLDESNPAKQKQMMKCLSEKYINRNKKRQQTSSGKKQKEIVDQSLKQVKNQNEKPQDQKVAEQQQEQVRRPRSESLVNVYVNSSDSQSSQIHSSQQKSAQNSQTIGFQLRQRHCSEDQIHDLDDQSNQFISSAIRLTPVAKPIIRLNQVDQVKKIQCQDIELTNSYGQEEIQRFIGVNNEPPRLKRLTSQDKEDIFQFIFLDLCIQLSDEYSMESSLIKKITGFISKMRQQSLKLKGFKTNSNAVKDCLFQLVTFLKNRVDLLEEVHRNMDKPLGPTALDILKYMHVYDDEPPQQQNNENVFIMDIKMFQQFEKVYLQTLEMNTYYQDEQKQKKRRIFIKNAVHIHNKAIFDALNQTIDKQRPFGVWGQPFPWKRSPRFYSPRPPTIKNNLILKCAQKTIEYCAYMCGFMVDKQDCNLRNNPSVTPAYIEPIRDDRLSRMLATQLEESQQKMLFIDDQETQILVQLGNRILQGLLSECALDLLQIYL